MLSECVECDRPAVSYWGEFAYCKQCIATEQVTNPKAHRCPGCLEAQPTNVSWRGELCGECVELAKRGGLIPKDQT